jgi:hypothetical protein
LNIGSYKNRSPDFGAQPAFCDEWIDDPTFGTGGSGINNDFALCLLDREVTVNQSKVKLILNTNSNIPLSSGDELMVMGLGALSQGAAGRKYIVYRRIVVCVCVCTFVSISYLV